MKLQYLGTAAAEGVPAIFCECENCKKSRQAGGRNIRTRSQAIIDDRLLIDFPADTYMHFLQFDLPLAKIKNCLITHSHSDHLYPDDLYMRKKGFSYLKNQAPLTFFSDEAGYKMIKDLKETKGLEDNEIMVNLIKLYQPFEVDGYNVVALRAAQYTKTSV